ncbi:MAG TPA: hypothetical protein VNH44_13605 [Micropepsaceae bacterium]|nr:hypothetical protein [Micropepsaceae bacterium]
MRVFAGVVAVLAVLSTPALAQSWIEYDYPDAGFAIHFPAAPNVATGLYETGAGAFVNAQIYSLQAEGNLYSVTVADLSGASTDPQNTLAQAVEAARSQGDIQVDIPARVNGQRGRQLSIVGKDGSHSNLAIFIAKDHLFEIKGTVLASNPDRQSGDAIRFQQSLRFTGDYAGRRFAQGAGLGPGGFRGNRAQFGQRFRRDGRGPNGAPPAAMPDPMPAQDPPPAQTP